MVFNNQSNLIPLPFSVMSFLSSLKLPRFLKKTRRPSESLAAGILRSTEPAARAHDHISKEHFDIPTALIVTEAERSRLRSWCKKEYLDNPYARNAARNFSLGVYGNGPALQINTPDENLNNKIEALFARWRKAVNLDWKLHIALESLFYDGEAFIAFYNHPTVPGGLDIELIEARRVRDPYTAGTSENRLEGITYNIYNDPVSYSIAKEPVNPIYGLATDFVEMPADLMVHFFLDDVVNQKRGLPLLQSVLETLSSLQRIGRASLNAWELAAKMNLVIKTPLEAYEYFQAVPEGYVNGEDNRITAFRTIPIPEDGGMTFLAQGMEATQVKSEHPTSAFHDNKMTYLSEIGAGVGEPRNVVTADSSSYNFSSAQLDYMMFYRWAGACQSKLHSILQRMLAAAVASAAESGNADAQQILTQYDPNDIPADWFFPQILEQVDRIQNANAEVQLLQAGLMTQKEYCKRHGIDYQKHMDQLANEKSILQNLGQRDSSSGFSEVQTEEG